MAKAQRASNLAGFSLLQISLILMVSGLILASVLPGKNSGDYNSKIISNVTKIDRIEQSMGSFMALNGRRPCPADGQYDVNDHNFGFEAGAITPNNIATPCQGGVPAAPLGPDSVTGYVVGGTVPTKTLGLTDDFAFDEWGRRFTYVVDTRATSAATCYNLQSINGKGAVAVQIKDPANNPVTTDNVMYAYISHGPDGHGAWPAQGSTLAGRINRGSTDADTLTNAGVDNTFSNTATSFTYNKIKKPKNAVFDDFIYYDDYVKNTCCSGTGCVVSNPAGFRVQGIATSDIAGTKVTTGDINGDGIADLIIGAPNVNSGAGAVYVIFGSKNYINAPLSLSALAGTNGFRIDGAAGGDNLGSSLAVGDINGDGIPDLIIGAPGALSGKGAAYVIFGGTGVWANMSVSALNGSTGVNGTNGFEIDGTSASGEAGYAVASGDINGDGIQDVIVGAPGVNSNNGRVYVVSGSTATWTGHTPVLLSALSGSTGVNGTDGFRLNGSGTEYAGDSVASGDINGDGIFDVIVGADYATVGTHAEAGQTYVVFGHTNPWAASKNLSSVNGATGFYATGVDTWHHSGYAVAAGDVNGDGLQDLIIGAPGSGVSSGNFGGSTYVVYGSTAAWPTTLDLNTLTYNTTGVRFDGTAYDRSGRSLYAGCDTNGDGIYDLVIGAPMSTPLGRGHAGAAYLVFGATTGWLSTQNLSTLNGFNGVYLEGVNADDNAGTSVSGGDFNGAGKCDVFVGAPNVTVGVNTQAGTVYGVAGKYTWTATFDLGTLP